jgi:hypothetical protein
VKRRRARRPSTRQLQALDVDALDLAFAFSRNPRAMRRGLRPRRALPRSR